MKTLSFILALTFASISLLAQEESKPTEETKVKVQEVGVAFSNFENFGLTYKIGNQKSLWRFYALYFSGDNSNRDRDDQHYKDNEYGFGLKVGKEFRKIIVSNLEFRYGADLIFDFTYSKNTYNLEPELSEYIEKQALYSPGIDFVVGLNYVIKNKLVLGIELLPFFSYNTGKETSTLYSDYSPPIVTTNKISGYSYGLSNSSVLLTIAYRF